jgi:hypothetical protein
VILAQCCLTYPVEVADADKLGSRERGQGTLGVGGPMGSGHLMLVVLSESALVGKEGREVTCLMIVTNASVVLVRDVDSIVELAMVDRKVLTMLLGEGIGVPGSQRT